MNTFIDITDPQKPVSIPIIGAVSLSTGDGLDTKTRYGYDYSKKPVSLVYRRRNTALTATVQAVFNNSLCLQNNVSIMDYLSTLEGMAGRKVRLIWNNQTISEFIVISVQFAGSVDCEDLFSQMQVSFSLTEGYVKQQTIHTKTEVL